MSLAFRKRIDPPVNKDWREWTKNGFVTKTVLWHIFVFSKAMCYILPDDIVNLIVWLTFKNTYISLEEKQTPNLWGNHLCKWLTFWISTPSQQRTNPLKIVKNSFELVVPDNIKNQAGDQCGIIIKQCNQSEIASISSFTAPRTGIYIGFSLPDEYDIKNIKSCTLHGTNLTLKNKYTFEDKYSFIVTDVDGQSRKFWRNGKFDVIPIQGLLHYDQIRFVFEFYDNTIQLNNISFLCVLSTISVREMMYEINEDDAEHHIIIGQMGQCLYVS